jgi:murein DD-endopeptidase MepM/ murein hydrolase activator NlpD
MAAAEGTVIAVYEDDTMGYTVEIRHEGGYTTRYASLAETVSVQKGDTVKLGQVIGCVGDTALVESVIGPHVHFSVTYRDAQIDPAEFFALGK